SKMLGPYCCRGSSLVERRPEKAGVASSILAPGTTGSHQSFFPKKIYLAVSEIGSFPVLSNRFQRDASKLFRQQLVELRDVFRLRKQLANLRQTGHGECAQFIQLRPD